jgi:TolB protein
MKALNSRLAISICLMLFCAIPCFAQQFPLGIFDRQSDVGPVKHPGSTHYDPAKQQYTISGSGTNIWMGNDEFHFVWKKMKGDFLLRTNAAFFGKGVDPRRKWGWMVRNSLTGDSKHVSAVVHGDGLTSMQYRPGVAANTEEIKSGLKAADVVQLEKKGQTYTMSVARNGEPFVSEQVDKLDLGEEVYIGLFVCSHNPEVSEQVVFNNVRIVVPATDELVPYRQYIGSNLEILDIESLSSKVIYQTPGSIQAPNWNIDGKSLIYNSEGLLYQYDLETNKPQVLNSGDVRKNNNDHVLSFDGKWLGISSGDGDKGASLIYVMPNTGGSPKLVTKTGPSYLHGWSPDGKHLVFTGQRNGDYDIYKVPVNGGPEIRLTNAPGLDDGPEYTPDGKFIYFNSVRSGLMQIYRMDADGKNQTQITNDGFNNWFPHISPDGKWIVFLSFLKEEVEPGDHPFYKHIYLRLMPVNGGPAKVIAYVYGGQGTINTPSWSPDSKQIALISNTSLLFPIYPIGK